MGFVNQAKPPAPAPQQGVPENFPGLETDETTHIGSKEAYSRASLPRMNEHSLVLPPDLNDLKSELMEQVADGKSTHMAFFRKISLEDWDHPPPSSHSILLRLSRSLVGFLISRVKGKRKNKGILEQTGKMWIPFWAMFIVYSSMIIKSPLMMQGP